MTVTPDVKQMLTPDQAAERICVSRRNLDRMRERGEGPAFYLLGEQTRRYDPRDLDEWVRAARREPSAS